MLAMTGLVTTLFALAFPSCVFCAVTSVRLDAGGQASLASLSLANELQLTQLRLEFARLRRKRPQTEVTSQGRIALVQTAEGTWDVDKGCAAEPTSKLAKDARPSVYVVIPGLGKTDNIPLVQQSLAWLRKQAVDVKCRIYVYNPSLEIPGGDSSLTPCTVQRTAGQWTDFLRQAPEEDWGKSDYVLVWLDDVKIDQNADLHYMLQVMRQNRLGVASPTYVPVTGRNRWKPMQQDSNSTVGRYTNLVEFQFTLLSPASFTCLRGMIEPQVNPRGWGLDRQFVKLCPGHCLGVFDTVTMIDTSECSYGCETARSEMQAFTVEHGEPPEPMSFGPLQQL